MANRIPYVLDSLISKFLLFILGLLIGGYYLHKAVDIFLFGGIFSLCVSALYLAFIGRKPPSESKHVKVSFKQLKALLICKARVKAYFLGSITFVILSRFTPFSVYYLVMASLLFTLAIVCRFVKN